MARVTRSQRSYTARPRRPMVVQRRTRRRARSDLHLPPLRALLPYVLNRRTAGVGLVVLAVASLPWLVPLAIAAILTIRDEAVRTLGLGAIMLVSGVLVSGLLIAQRQFGSSPDFWRRYLAAVLAGIALLGLLAFWRPQWTVGDVAMSQTSAGGRLGQSLIDGGWGTSVWLGLLVVSAALAWPQAIIMALAATPGALAATWRFIVRLQIPQRVWSATVFAINLLLPKETVREPQPETENDWETFEPDFPPEEYQALPAPQDTGAISGDLAEEIGPVDAASPAVARAPAGTGAPERSAESSWSLPVLDLLYNGNGNGKSNGNGNGNGKPKVDNAARAQLIVDTLASFGVDARVVQINEGPTVTQFGVEPGWEIKTRTVPERDMFGRPTLDKDGNPRTRVEEVSRTRVRVNRITNLANDLALALAAPSIRIEAPVPGQSVIGIEVPNTTPSMVTLRSVIESAPFQRLAARSRLALALGKGVSGEPVVADLARMPHLLIAGATGSGKSVCLNSIVACLLMHCTPDDVRFVMIDPKRVEMAPYASIPHLAFSSIVVDVDKVPATLQTVINEMDARYRRFAEVGARHIEAYNRNPKVEQRLPYWVVIIDELADLMMAAAYEVERQICRLAQLARATGIHLIIATQRPSVDVVTGLIKANFPTRIAFAVTSQVDSRTILDTTGAEKLLGRGDMLFMPTDAAKPKRIQGVYVSDQEIERLVQFWSSERFRHLRPPTLDDLLDEAQSTREQRERDDASDPLLPQVRELAQQHSRISASMLQRRLRIGYPRAARLMDLLEEEGLLGPVEEGQSRTVLADRANKEQ